MRRSSAIINPVAAAAAASFEEAAAKRRSNSWSLSDAGDHSDDEDNGASASLAEQLTGQRWHEVGNGPPPIRATDEFEVMVDQLSAILSSRLRDLLVHWMSPPRPDATAAAGDEAKQDPAAAMESRNQTMAMALECLKLDERVGDYVLKDSVANSMREYVKCIGRCYHAVGFHSFEHCAHVTLSMNKLLSLIHKNLRDSLKRRTSEQSVHNYHYAAGGANFSFGIGDDPRILFALVFSALIHDVGHTGVPNSVLVEEEDELAILHNDVSVAEQNSLQVAFSLLQKDEFAILKRCICPTPEERKFFRKTVISMVMVTDISDQERVQIVASRWNAAFPPAKEGEENNGSDEEGKDKGEVSETARTQRKGIQSPELRASIRRRRFTMFSSDAAAEEFAKRNRSRRLGIRTSMDFSGMLLDAYSTTDQLQQHAVLETMMNAADIAHTMQSFSVFVKWNRRLFKEFYRARRCGRLSFDPAQNWAENQIGFFTHYVIPLSQKMKVCGVFGTTGNVFEYFAAENKKRWIEEGEQISEQIIRETIEEVEAEQGLQNGCH